MLENVVNPITCVSMNHQNQLEQMANGAMFATYSREGDHKSKGVDITFKDLLAHN
jgi:hypothetical protein